MILAAAACAEGRGPPPPELEMAWHAQSWHALPEGGGLRDQLAGEVRRMSAALNVYEAFRSWRGSRDWVRWARANPETWAIVRDVVRLKEGEADLIEGDR